MPVFWLSQLLIMAFAVHLRLLPAQGMMTLRDPPTGFGAVLDVLWSVASYELLVADWDLDARDAVAGVTWAIGLVEDAIRNGRGPHP